MATTREQNYAGEQQLFTVNGLQLLESGNSMAFLARAEQLWLHAKIYADGGENGLHAHPEEDHAFFILSGSATFTASDGSTRTVGPFDGLMVPRGVEYKFQSTGEGNLVMLRIGAGDTADEASDAHFPAVMAKRTGVQPNSPDNKTGAVAAKVKSGAVVSAPTVEPAQSRAEE